MTAKDHNNLLGILILIQGGLTLLTGVFLLIMYGVFGVALIGAGGNNDARIAGGVVLVVAVVVCVVIAVFSALYLFTGFKIRQQQSIGRTLGIVVSVLSLFSFPLGTALGVYGLWFLLGDLGKGLYLGTGSTGFTSAAPPPNSWQ